MIQVGIDLTPVITHKMHVDDYRKGFEIMKSGKCGKIILEWNN